MVGLFSIQIVTKNGEHRILNNIIHLAKKTLCLDTIGEGDGEEW